MVDFHIKSTYIKFVTHNLIHKLFLTTEDFTKVQFTVGEIVILRKAVEFHITANYAFLFRAGKFYVP